MLYYHPYFIFLIERGFVSQLVIERGAVFIADAHYNTHRTDLLDLCDAILQEDIVTTQMWLMGDIFDLLIGPLEHLVTYNHPLIEKLQALSLKIPIIYFEGNHDFLLASLFPKIYVIPRTQHPVILRQDGKVFALSHGDIFTPWGYNLYTWLLRSSVTIKFLDWLTTNRWNGKFALWQVQRLAPKKLCRSIANFEALVKKRYVHLSGIDEVIEGHFHQGVMIKDAAWHYTNLPAYACDQRYGVWDGTQMIWKKL